jgi:hypothetical protein
MRVIWKIKVTCVLDVNENSWFEIWGSHGGEDDDVLGCAPCRFVGITYIRVYTAPTKNNIVMSAMCSGGTLIIRVRVLVPLVPFGAFTVKCCKGTPFTFVMLFQRSGGANKLVFHTHEMPRAYNIFLGTQFISNCQRNVRSCLIFFVYLVIERAVVITVMNLSVP